MEVHRLEQFWIVLSLLLIVGFIATVTYGSVGFGVKMVGDRGGTVENPSNPAQSPNFRTPGVYKTGPNEYAVYLVARQFFFQPGTRGASDPIEVPAGSRVTFYVTSRDVIHGLEVVGTNINTMAIPGQIGQLTVDFNRPAEYGIVCHEYCGTGHHLMEGQLKVVPPSQFQEPEEQE